MRALICGVSGQDGAYLAQWLLDHGYEVCGTSRRLGPHDNLVRLGIADRVRLLVLDSIELTAVANCLEAASPDEIYHLAGQSSVGASFTEPVASWQSIAISTQNLLEAVRRRGKGRLFVASSSECFGDTGDAAANETTPFHPCSPYAVAKAAAYWLTATYRRVYGLHASSGILFNHESPLRPEYFVTRKITAAVSRIAAGSQERLGLGNLNVKRDWGWAPEYVEAMWLMLQQSRPDDYVIATGECRLLRDFVATAFATVGLDWRDHTDLDPTLGRPTDPTTARANPTKVRTVLGWHARRTMTDVARLMVRGETYFPAAR